MAKLSTLSHDDVMIEQLKTDAKFAAHYLNEALKSPAETWREEFIIALGHIVQAKGVSPKVLSHGKTKDAIYKALSKHRNPTLDTLRGMLDGVGMEMTIKPKARRA